MVLFIALSFPSMLEENFKRDKLGSVRTKNRIGMRTRPRCANQFENLGVRYILWSFATSSIP